jgi:hypothetical protein
MTQNSSAPEYSIQLHSENALSEPPLLPSGQHGQPLVTMPGLWQMHCSGCRAPAPETYCFDETVKRSSAGCRCFMCPEWFACPSCSEKEAAAHQQAFPDEVHVMYSVDPVDEQYFLDNETTSHGISPWGFAFKSFVWPFLKMLMPSISVLLQVLIIRICALTTWHLMFFAQMFLFLMNIRCTSTEPAAGGAFSLALAAVVSFYCGMLGIVLNTVHGASEALIFENLLLSSIFVDFRSSESSFFSKYKMFLCFLILFVASYIGFSTAAISSAADVSISINSTLALSNSILSLRKQVVPVILSNALALAGGAYFLWTLHYESIELGRHSMTLLKANSVSNSKKISSMKCVSISQMKLVSRAFISSSKIADILVRKFPHKFSSGHINALRERLCSPSHVHAACMQLNVEKVTAIETTLFNTSFPRCCTNFISSCWQLCLRDVMFLEPDKFSR